MNIYKARLNTRLHFSNKEVGHLKRRLEVGQDYSNRGVGRSEKYKGCIFQKAKEISEPRHSTDFRTVFGIMIGQLSSCEIWQKFLTENRGRFGNMMRPDFK